MIGRVIDKVIAPLAPGLAVRRMAARAALQQLAVHGAARKDRTRRDWPARNTSANQAVIGDMPTLIARARQTVRDTPHGESLVHAYQRKVVGTGITPSPAARNADGELLEEFNDFVDSEWRRWSRRGKFCDIEGRKSIPAAQRLAVRELVLVGQAFIALNYTRRPHSEPLGIELQAFEPEQLDTTIQSYGGFRVRHGIEVDQFTRARAYHFFPQHPLDVDAVPRRESVRIEADRLIHLIDPVRVQQIHGVTWLRPVLNKIRDAGEYDATQLWVARMEACIGLIRKHDPDYGQSTGVGGLKVPDGDDGVDVDGNTEVHFQPGMVVNAYGNEDIQPFVPQRPGGGYDPFMTRQLKSIAAGGRLSYGQVARDFTLGRYSSQRQEMLEDYAEIDWIEELVCEQMMLEIYELFVVMLVVEGRVQRAVPSFKEADFWHGMSRYLEVDWQGPPRPWIDPEKEAKADGLALLWRLTSRGRLLNRQGISERELLREIEASERLLKKHGVRAPEVSGDPEATPTIDDDSEPVDPDHDDEERDDDRSDRRDLAARSLRALEEEVLTCS